MSRNSYKTKYNITKKTFEVVKVELDYIVVGKKHSAVYLMS